MNGRLTNILLTVCALVLGVIDFYYFDQHTSVSPVFATIRAQSIGPASTVEALQVERAAKRELLHRIEALKDEELKRQEASKALWAAVAENVKAKTEKSTYKNAIYLRNLNDSNTYARLFLRLKMDPSTIQKFKRVRLENATERSEVVSFISRVEMPPEIREAMWAEVDMKEDSRLRTVLDNKQYLAYRAYEDKLDLNLLVNQLVDRSFYSDNPISEDVADSLVTILGPHVDFRGFQPKLSDAAITEIQKLFPQYSEILNSLKARFDLGNDMYGVYVKTKNDTSGNR